MMERRLKMKSLKFFSGDVGDVETDRSNDERSRATQGDAEGSEGLATEESTKVEQLGEDKRVKKRPHGSHKWRKRPAPQSLQSGPRTKKIPWRNINQESERSREGTSNVESLKKPEALYGKSSPCLPRSKAGITKRQVIPGRTSPYLTRSRAETRMQGEIERSIKEPEE
ncbi:hypothetical protein TNIN_483171 [Trichonephila inaurata madagascariensis]|uniref:Uncharacterized protein n=1 Tax=Trichonephila inaurata madagascariensis TaxID=2747483 RepID=A0A8X7C5Q5_9ARAC|nr:hypothetical protein TNIN_483171 [Trichonephila inaurata madagascariensis]